MSDKKSPLPIELPTANELQLQEQISLLQMQVTYLERQITNTLRHIAPHQVGVGVPITAPPSSEKINILYRDGLGPLFRRVYAECRSDAERQAMMSSLKNPMFDYKSGRSFSGYIIAQGEETWRAVLEAVNIPENVVAVEDCNAVTDVVHELQLGRFATDKIYLLAGKNKNATTVLFYSSTNDAFVELRLPKVEDVEDRPERSSFRDFHFVAYYTTPHDGAWVYGSSAAGNFHSWSAVSDLLESLRINPKQSAAAHAARFEDLYRIESELVELTSTVGEEIRGALDVVDTETSLRFRLEEWEPAQYNYAYRRSFALWIDDSYYPAFKGRVSAYQPQQEPQEWSVQWNCHVSLTDIRTFSRIRPEHHEQLADFIELVRQKMLDKIVADKAMVDDVKPDAVE